jgi:hypothetical protein
VRQLHFRGIEFSTTYGFFGSSPTYAGPKVEIRDAVVNPNFAPAIRYIPGPNLYATFTSIPGLVPGGATTPPIVRICYDLGPGFSVVVPAGSSSGLGLAAVWFDMAPIPAGQGLMILGSGLEPMTWPASASFSGVTDLAGNSVLLPNPGFSSEYTFTWLFEDSMIQPVRNAKLLPAGSQIPGGVPNPAPFAVDMDDGRGALFPNVGDVISYNGNSIAGNPLPGPNPGNVWFIPFVLLSSDTNIPGTTNPLPESWPAGNAPIHPMSIQKWLDDFTGLVLGAPPGTGVALNPNNFTFGLWLGIDLPGYLNLPVLANALAFADMSAGAKWSGPGSVAYDSPANPSGLLGRNLISITGSNYLSSGGPLAGIHENRTILCGPQAGYTPLVPAPGSPGFLGFGAIPPGLAGQSFGIQCWLLDGSSGRILDTTNVAIVRL